MSGLSEPPIDVGTAYSLLDPTAVGSTVFAATRYGTRPSIGTIVAGSDLRWAAASSTNDWNYSTGVDVSRGPIGVGTWMALGGSSRTGKTVSTAWKRIA